MFSKKIFAIYIQKRKKKNNIGKKYLYFINMLYLFIFFI